MYMYTLFSEPTENMSSYATSAKVQICDNSAADHCLVESVQETADSHPNQNRAALEDLYKTLPFLTQLPPELLRRLVSLKHLQQ